MQSLYAGIEFGGTKTICAVGNLDGALVDQTTIPTTTVDETLSAAFEFLDRQDEVAAVGIGAFGPIDLQRSSPNFGALYNTPREGWNNVPLRRLFEEHFQKPTTIDLDVNCAAMGELHWGEAKDLDNFAYMTLGTGIGGALVVGKRAIQGVCNLEFGHMRIPHDPFTDDFRGACDYHGDCLEGIASGYAIQLQHGMRAEYVTDPALWDTQAQHVAQALNNIMMIFGPEKVILGGGLMRHKGLIESIRTRVGKLVNDYMPFPDLDEYIVASMGDDNGVLGAIYLASQQS